MTDVIARSPTARIVWVSAGAICLFTVENVWIDPLIHHRLPSLVPDALGGMWFFVLMALGITLILAVFCQVLLMRDDKLPRQKKALTGIIVMAAAALACKWFLATGGMTIVEGMHLHQRHHTVMLQWHASTTMNVRYNLYRGPRTGFHPEKLNAAPIDALTFTDTTTENGLRYYYVVRAVDAAGRESFDSNETLVRVP